MLLGKMSNFKQRFTISALAVPLTVCLILFSLHPYIQPFFCLFIIVAVHFSLKEFYHLVESKGIEPLKPLALTASFLYLFSLYFEGHYPSLELLPTAILYLFLMLSFVYFFKEGNHPIFCLATTFFGLAYLTIPIGTVISILFYLDHESSEDSRIWLLYLLSVVKMTDTFAYFVGKTWGKNKLAPILSPKKTWEGAIGGVLGGVLVSTLFYWFGIMLQLPFSLGFLSSLILGLLLSFLGQISDLAESLLKRDAQVKDSSSIPGLGGVLDIVDSLVFTAPLLYIWLKLYY
jgi:phosphatidate cytidylyltransferase